MGAKGTQTSNTNQTQTYAPTSQATNAITGALTQAQTAAGQQQTVPTAPVAGLTPQQLQAFGLAGNTGIQNPYLSQAQSYFQQGSQPNISQFYNPEASAVTAQLNNIFGQQNVQNTGSLTQAAGGVGADRIAVGQANLANQQGLAAGQTLANLYTTAGNQALQQESATQGAGYGVAGLGAQAQGANTQDITNLLTAGGLQQQQSQAQLNAPYQQQLAQMALPYQQSQFLTGAVGSLAPALGGTTAGQGQTTSQYDPSVMSQILGGGLLGTSLVGGTGGFGSNGWATTALKGLTGVNRGGAVYGHGGSVNPFFDDGGGVGGSIFSSLMGQPASGQPIDVSHLNFAPSAANMPHAQSHIPTLNLTPQTPNMQPNQGQQMQQLGQLTKGIGQAYNGFNDAAQDAAQDLAEGDARGGVANPYDDGGSVKDQSYYGQDNSQLNNQFSAYYREHLPNLGPSLKEQEQQTSSRAKKPQRSPFQGYDDGGDVTDPFGDTNRQIGYDMLRQGMGTTAPDSIPGGEPPPSTTDRSINPDQPYRLAGPDAMNVWRNGVDSDTSAGLTNAAPSDTPTMTATSQPTSDDSDLPTIITSGDKGNPYQSTDDTTALAYSGDKAKNVAPAPAETPADTSSSSDDGTNALGKFMQSPWMTLAQAGLGAWTPQGIAGGLQSGLKNMQAQQTIQQSAKRLAQEAKFHEDSYNRLTAYQTAELDRQKQQDKLAQDRFNRPYNELTAMEKAQLEESKRQHDLARVPQGYREDDKGNLVPIPGGPHSPEQIKSEADAKRLPAMSREDMQPMVDAYLAGDHSVMNGVGRGAQGPQNIQQFWQMTAEHLRAAGQTGEQIAAAKANFMGEQAALRTAAVRDANISTAVNEAKLTFPQLLQRSAELPRTSFVPFNQALEYYRNKTGSPEQQRYGAALQASITAYSQAMSRTGANSVYAQQHAEAILEKAQGPEAMKAAVEQLDIEMGIAQRAPEETRQAILNRILGIKTGQQGQQPGTGATSAQSPGATSAAPAQTAPARTVVRQGTVNSGPNQGKKVIEYSDGTREYQ